MFLFIGGFMKKYLLPVVLTLFFIESAFAVPQVIAHRGYWDCAGSAENSVASLKKAADLKIYGTEFDVQMTADSVPVVFHDDRVNGIRVSDMTCEELKKVRYSNGESVSTLEEYLKASLSYPKLRLIIELKPQRLRSRERLFAETVCGLIREYGLENRVEFISFDLYLCRLMKKSFPSVSVAYLKGDLLPITVAHAGLDGIDYEFRKLKRFPHLIADAHECGLFVNTWTLCFEEEYLWADGHGVDYVTTDDPQGASVFFGADRDNRAVFSD